jgi:hypothetical protein
VKNGGCTEEGQKEKEKDRRSKETEETKETKMEKGGNTKKV